jgi:type I restriction enzyme, R subunit
LFFLYIKFAYATNGRGIVEHDSLTGRDNDLDTFPNPDDLWERLRGSDRIDEATAERVLAPCYHLSGKSPRYYQEIAINRTVQAILQGKRRILLTLATGTGKTVIAFQVSYKLWTSRWNRAGEHRRPRILYLADRNILVDDPKDKTFTPFGDARWKIEGKIVKSREMYFATYQAIARDEHRPGLYREFPRDFFDLIVVPKRFSGEGHFVLPRAPKIFQILPLA